MGIRKSNGREMPWDTSPSMQPKVEITRVSFREGAVYIRVGGLTRDLLLSVAGGCHRAGFVNDFLLLTTLDVLLAEDGCQGEQETTSNRLGECAV